MHKTANYILNRKAFCPKRKATEKKDLVYTCSAQFHFHTFIVEP